MSPLLTTFAGDSLKPYGFGLGGGAIAGLNYLLRFAPPSGTATGYGVGSDSLGNSYFASSSGGTSNNTLAKISPTNTLTWQRQFNFNPFKAAYIDKQGNAYLLGYDTSNTNALVVKYNSSGTLQFQKLLNTSGQIPTAICADSSGNIYVGVGYYSGVSQGAIVKLDSTGATVWQRSFYDSNFSGAYTYGISTDSSGNVYVVGGVRTSGYDYEWFAIKYDQSGTLQWQRQLAGSAGAVPDQANSVVVDSTGAPIVVGYLYVGAYQRAVVAKYNASTGSLTWYRMFDNGSAQIGYGVAVDPLDNVYMLSSPIPGNPYRYMVSKYNSSGTIQWQRQIYLTSAAGETPTTISADASNVYVTGSTGGASPIPFTISIPTNGSKTGTYSVGAFGYTYSASTYTDSSPATFNNSLTWANGTPAYTVSAGAGTDSAGSNTLTITTV